MNKQKQNKRKQKKSRNKRFEIKRISRAPVSLNGETTGLNPATDNNVASFLVHGTYL